MSKPPPLRASALQSAALGIARAPRRYDRQGRVELLAEVFKALLENRAPSREAALFVGGGGLSWLQQGGDLCKTFWKVTGEAGSHRTPTHVWRELSESSSRGRQESGPADTVAPPSKSEPK